MFFIPGPVIALLTFPGIIVHEMAHFLFCRLRRVAVFEVCYFRFGNPAGYVTHERIVDFNTAFLVCVGPFIINTLLCLLICFPAFIPVRLYNLPDPFAYLLLWLGISIGMHAFPSTGDADALWYYARIALKGYHPLAVLSCPIIGLIYVAHFAKMLWFDAIYAAGIGLGLPTVVLKYVI